ncbi:nitric oxide reductase transcriptional regulator NorR [Shewanella loihica]|uniref:Transcriptional regulator, NifA subfamily, Fis family n=1 Tax=Shewanella loihica (strain ATCC BAA-1088 / PV-4) TaxID=323850 RepID=A3QAN0_SHELP|nr:MULTISPECIES: nitric oxide reductase transcriptional regulator NorR [Shewanella]ABO22528.1 transcriptional regulator, NifA subfamily, Fis family [Shewanella loihica PV-4]QYJ98290.1 nitric oxide reductase transcriptional regulator NorR [Shewanella alkalitolerans]
MALSQTQLTRMALDITSGLSNHDRFSRLLDTIRESMQCDAAALLEFKGQQFTPLAINGLSPDVLGRRFVLHEHPRLEAIARAGDVVRFPADSDLPDPYDGLIPNQGDNLTVHACIGLPLLADGSLIGAVTIDGFDPDQFKSFTNEQLRGISAIASASLNNALLIDKLEKQALQAQWDKGDSTSQSKEGTKEIIGQSQVMNNLKQEIAVVAPTDLNVLIMGETGTGKELIAHEIHQGSMRASQPLVYLNCAALPESVAESELFGHVKGAFTGAVSNRSGKFEMADKGSLFLDEIGELPLTLQAKLLRVLQYGDLQRVGDDRSLKVDVRIIAATNKNLKNEVLAGRFRADLYHRLSVFPLIAPPLREREQDITLLSGFFVERCRQQLGLQTLRLSPTSLAMLECYQWPGNVRELEHSIYRAAILARAQSSGSNGVINPEHFEFANQAPRAVQSSGKTLAPQFSGSLKQATEAFQADYIRQTLSQHDNNWAATARDLEVDSGNLHRLAKRIGLK